MWFLSNDSTARIKLAKAQANIKASETVQHHPLSNGDELTTLETPILLFFHYHIYLCLFKTNNDPFKNKYLQRH
ncbi:hypothetical protein D0463_03060 [Bacillus sp. V59.32b]|nr:hypothetical protein D0463_03060 [Bacillus sp. V59.32b]